MRTFKKIIAVLVTLSMLLGAVALTASAGEIAVVKLTGRTQLELRNDGGENYEIYSLDLVVSEESGGVQGTISYDKNYFEFVSVDFSDEFTAANKGTNNVYKVNADNGTIAFIGINPGADITWFTVNFKPVALTDAVEGAEFAIGDGAFELMASNTDGTGTVLPEVNVPGKVEIVTAGQVDVLGATIRGTGAVEDQDIGFYTNIGYQGEATIIEYGAIFLPAKLLPKGAELLVDATYGTNSLGKPVKAAVATYKLEDADEAYKTEDGTSLKNDVRIRATLAGSASFKMSTLLTTDFVSRSYIKLADGTILYSNNDGGAKGAAINNGYATKSIAGVTVSMAKALSGVFAQMEKAGTLTDEQNADKTTLSALLLILDKSSFVEDDKDNVLAVLNILVKNISLIPNNQ